MITSVHPCAVIQALACFNSATVVPKVRISDRASPLAGPVITHTAMSFLPHVDAGATLDYCLDHLLFLSAVKSAIRAYAEIFSLGPAHQSGIPARESSQFRLRAHTTTQCRPISSRHQHCLAYLHHFHQRG
jgi:hypothetical protein